MEKKYRLFNNDLNEVHDYYNTINEARRNQLLIYFFMTSIQEYRNGKWVDITR